MNKEAKNRVGELTEYYNDKIIKCAGEQRIKVDEMYFTVDQLFRLQMPQTGIWRRHLAHCFEAT